MSSLKWLFRILESAETNTQVQKTTSRQEDFKEHGWQHDEVSTSVPVHTHTHTNMCVLLRAVVKSVFPDHQCDSRTRHREDHWNPGLPWNVSDVHLDNSFPTTVWLLFLVFLIISFSTVGLFFPQHTFAEMSGWAFTIASSWILVLCLDLQPKIAS